MLRLVVDTCIVKMASVRYQLKPTISLQLTVPADISTSRSMGMPAL